MATKRDYYEVLGLAKVLQMMKLKSIPQTFQKVPSRY